MHRVEDRSAQILKRRLALSNITPEEITMNKLVALLTAAAFSMGAFAATPATTVATAPAVTTAAPAAAASEKKPAMKKMAKAKKAKKSTKKTA